MQHPTSSVSAMVAMGAAASVLIVLIFRTLTAKTGKAAAINLALAQCVGLFILVLQPFSGLGPSPEEWRQAQKLAPKPEELFKAVPWEVFVAAAIWMIGGTCIFLRQRRRAGESWLQAINPFGPFARHMDRKSWFQVLVLAVLALTIGQAGLVRNTPDRPQGAAEIQSRPS